MSVRPVLVVNCIQSKNAPAPAQHAETHTCLERARAANRPCHQLLVGLGEERVVTVGSPKLMSEASTRHQQSRGPPTMPMGGCSIVCR